MCPGSAGAPKPPEIERIGVFPVTSNDETATVDLTGAFRAHFGESRVMPAPLVTGSEDFGRVTGVPSVFWLVGGMDPETVVVAMTTAAGSNRTSRPAIRHCSRRSGTRCRRRGSRRSWSRLGTGSPTRVCVERREWEHGGWRWCCERARPRT